MLLWVSLLFYPLNATDPSGYFYNKLFKALNKAFGKFAPFLSILLLAIPGVGAWAISSWQNAYTFGFWTGGIASGSYRGAITGGLSAAAFHGIGAKFSSSKPGFFQKGGLGHIGTHAVAGGITSVAQGGKFGHGFVSSGLTKIASPAIQSVPGPKAGRVALASLLGGSVSHITGGKFANGAITSAFSYAFNQEGGCIER